VGKTSDINGIKGERDSNDKFISS